MELKEKALTVWKIYFNIYFMRYLSSPASSAIEHLKYKTMFCFMFVCFSTHFYSGSKYCTTLRVTL